MRSKSIYGYAIVALSSLIFGLNGIYARYISLPTPIIIFYRYLFGAIALGSFLFLKNRKLTIPKKDKKEIFIISIFGTLASIFAFYAFVNTSIANAEILLYAAPIYSVLIAWIILGEKIKKITWVSIALAFLGVILTEPLLFLIFLLCFRIAIFTLFCPAPAQAKPS